MKYKTPKAKRSTRISRLSSDGSSKSPATITGNNFEAHAQYCATDNSVSTGVNNPSNTQGAGNPSHWNMTYNENDEKNDDDDCVYTYINESK